ncbi:tripartite motif-containing protein 59 isoform X1 [Ascaphus truei]|uniref:tripartite motif-containing protein 59 isoform X1 n=2 Tax=Ascaphus truei TaxID=8439 RepID=UPI003F5ABF74
MRRMRRRGDSVPGLSRQQSPECPHIAPPHSRGHSGVFSAQHGAQKLHLRLGTGRSQDMDNFEEELTCSICYGIFEDPRVLPCSHTFCRNCLENVIKSADSYLWRPSSLRCPSCRRTAELSPAGVNSLPINFALKSIIEKYDKDDHRNMATCTEHHRQPLNVFCLKDRKLVCGHCLTVGQHQGHPIDDLQSAYIKERETPSQLLGILSDKHFTGVSSVIKKLEEQMDYCKSIVQDDKREVSRFFEKLNDTLEQKKQDLLAALNCVNQQIAEVYTPQIEKMKEMQDEELDLISLSSSTQEEESPLAFLENIHDIRQRMKALKSQQLVSIYPVEIHPRIGHLLKEEWLKKNTGEIHQLPTPQVKIRFKKREENGHNTKSPYILLAISILFSLLMFLMLCKTDILPLLYGRYWTYLCEAMQMAVDSLCSNMQTVKVASLRISGVILECFTNSFSYS